MESKEHLLSKISIWDNLNISERKLFLDYSYYKSFTAKQIVHSTYQHQYGLFVVKSGVLKAQLLSEDGKTATLFRVKENDFCVISMACILSSLPYDIQVIAEQDTTILFLPIDVFNSISQNNIYVENFAYKKLIERFSDVVSALEQISFMTLEQRILKFLQDEAAYYSVNKLNITHDELAQNISSSREGVSRTLKQMEKQGILKLNRGSITLYEN